MKQFRYKKIDAFTGERSSGNPAGVVYLNSPDDITPAVMQRIARELKGFVSEAVYRRKVLSDMIISGFTQQKPLSRAYSLHALQPKM